ncbi:MAG TPA: arylesterase [Acidobacteriaceae bacterium]|nr:arylesterase [Acidobacteriaceae bacterium]
MKTLCAFLLLLFTPLAFAKHHPPAPVIVCFGDSLTAGYGAPSGDSYPDYLEQILDARGYRYHIVNMGVSGDTTADGVARLPKVLAAHPAIVIVEFGGNDAGDGVPINTTRANFVTIISTLQKAGITVTLVGIKLPDRPNADYEQAFGQTYTLAAKIFQVLLLPNLFIHLYNVPNAFQPDGVHGTPKGNRIMAEDVYSLIQPLLQKHKKHN